MFPPSDAAITLSGSIIANAPKTQSTILKPVNPLAAQAAGSTTFAIVPFGALTFMHRKKPSLAGTSLGSMHFTPQYVAALVNDNVLFIAPLTCSSVPDQSASRLSPCFLNLTNNLIGLPMSTPSSSIQSSKLHSPSGSSDKAARVTRSVYSTKSFMKLVIVSTPCSWTSSRNCLSAMLHAAN